MDVDKSRLPRWGWMLLALFSLAMVATFVNALVMVPLGLPEAYQVVTIIAAMSPALIFVGIWYDDDRQHYWEHSRARIVSDVVFVVFGTAVGAAFAVVLLVDTGFGQLIRDLLAMTAGFTLGWVLFWFRNPEVYQDLSG